MSFSELIKFLYYKSKVIFKSVKILTVVECDEKGRLSFFSGSGINVIYEMLVAYLVKNIPYSHFCEYPGPD